MNELKTQDKISKQWLSSYKKSKKKIVGGTIKKIKKLDKNIKKQYGI